MRKGLKNRSKSNCPIHLALEVIGDRWTLLIVRDLMFKNRKTFKDFLNAEESISSNILSDRLATLEKLKIVKRLQDPADARRVNYRLTKRGVDLAPILVEIVLWASKNFNTAVTQSDLREMSERREKFLNNVISAWKKTQND